MIALLVFRRKSVGSFFVPTKWPVALEPESFASCSDAELLDARVRWLERARNLAKELREVCEEWALAEAKALLAEWLIAHRRSLNIGLAPDDLAEHELSADPHGMAIFSIPNGGHR
jgi:hypothetical protein